MQWIIKFQRMFEITFNAYMMCLERKKLKATGARRIELKLTYHSLNICAKLKHLQQGVLQSKYHISDSSTGCSAVCVFSFIRPASCMCILKETAWCEKRGASGAAHQARRFAALKDKGTGPPSRETNQLPWANTCSFSNSFSTFISRVRKVNNFNGKIGLLE